MTERRCGRMADALTVHGFNNAEDVPHTLLDCVALCNHQSINQYGVGCLPPPG